MRHTDAELAALARGHLALDLSVQETRWLTTAVANWHINRCLTTEQRRQIEYVALWHMETISL